MLSFSAGHRLGFAHVMWVDFHVGFASWTSI